MASIDKSGKYSYTYLESYPDVTPYIRLGSKIVNNNEQDQNTLIDAFNIDWSGYKIGDDSIKYTGDLINKLNEGNIGSGGGTNVTVDENNNSFSADGVQYTLTIDANGILRFQNYSAITLSSVTSAKSFEYNSGAHTFTVSATPSKNCTVTDRWEDSSAGNSYSANTTISASVTSFNDTSYTLTVKETDKNATKTATVNVNYNQYRYWSGTNSTLYTSSTSTSTLKSSLSNSNTNSNGYPSQINFSASDVSGGKYLYILIKKKSSFTFKIGQGTTPGDMSGGMTLIHDDITDVYDSSKKYQLWGSTEIQTAACNITIS